MSTIFVTNIPAPYREKIHELVSLQLNGDYSVLYCAAIEPNRKWKFDFGSYKHLFLKSKSIQIGSRTIYLWSNVLKILQQENPATIILGGFSMPMVTAYIWAKIKRRKIIAFSDATIESEKQILRFHQKILRKFTYPYMDAYIGASLKTLQLFKHYAWNNPALFQSQLCCDNNKYFSCYTLPSLRAYDIILCGQFIEGKLFDFSIEVLKKVSIRKKNLKIKLVGDGPLRNAILNSLEQNRLDYCYQGFIQPSELAVEYASAKLFLFPTKRDAWGVVANEACAAGTPVITCHAAGAANELIKNGVNGYVLPLDAELWAQEVTKLLENINMLNELSKNAIKEVEPYNYGNAALGIVKAVAYVSQREKTRT